MSDFEDYIEINHYKIICEFEDNDDEDESYMIYKEWKDGTNFEFLGSFKSKSEWIKFKKIAKLLQID